MRSTRTTQPRRWCRMAAVLLLGTVATVAPATPAAADAIRDQQWYLAALGVPAAHAVTRGEGVTVAVVDTGVAADHPDLVGSVLPGIDGRTGTGDGQQDLDGHGTALAVVTAGHGHGSGNTAGVLGVAPGARILPVNVSNFDHRDGLEPEHVARGIDFAVERGAKVINVAVGTSGTPVLRDAVLRALDADVVIVAAVGNLDEHGMGTMHAPVYFEGVVRVCAHDRRGEHAAFSLPAQGDTQLTVCAPGVDGVSARPDGTYQTGQGGTSMSSAIVSGVVALIRSKYPDMPAHEVVNRLTATATDKGEPGLDKLYGYGNVNLGAALNNNVAPGPSPTPWVSRSPGATPTGRGTPSTTTAAEPPDDTTGIPVAALAGGAGAVVLVVLLGGLWLLRRRSRAQP